MNFESSSLPANCCGIVIFVFGSGCERGAVATSVIHRTATTLRPRIRLPYRFVHRLFLRRLLLLLNLLGSGRLLFPFGTHRAERREHGGDAATKQPSHTWQLS